MSNTERPLPNVLAYPLAEAGKLLEDSGYVVRCVRETAAPNVRTGSSSLRVARVRFDEEKVDLVVVAAEPETMLQRAP